MLDTKELLEMLIAGKPLTAKKMQECVRAILEGDMTEPVISAFLVLLRVKGYSTEELCSAAQEMYRHAQTVSLCKSAIDIVGTGGDGLNTFNISTFAAFVIAGANVPVAKHGSRSVSSNSGSSNVLDYAGIPLCHSEEVLNQQLRQSNICFLFAPLFHPAMKHVAEVRKTLGIRTFFNLLGPLLNPAKVKKQVIGVYSQALMPQLSEVLSSLGSEHHLILNAEDGMDEISVVSPTHILEYKGGKRSMWLLQPSDYGLSYDTADALVVQSPEESLETGLQVLSGIKGCAYDIVTLNAAAAIYCYEGNLCFEEALERARTSIDSGKALQCFHHLQKCN